MAIVPRPLPGSMYTPPPTPAAPGAPGGGSGLPAAPDLQALLQSLLAAGQPGTGAGQAFFNGLRDLRRQQSGFLAPMSSRAGRTGHPGMPVRPIQGLPSMFQQLPTEWFPGGQPSLTPVNPATPLVPQAPYNPVTAPPPAGQMGINPPGSFEQFPFLRGLLGQQPVNNTLPVQPPAL